MTAKEFVQNKIPHTYAERQISGMIKGLQETYWLIRQRGKTMYIASGKTESNAWVNAKKVLMRKEKTK